MHFLPYQSSRAGIALAETLAFMGCILIVLALSIPQLLRYREHARAKSCQSNLRLIGTALENYHETHLGLPPGYFPSNYVARKDGSASWRPPRPSYSWAAFLLPFIGHEDLHRELDVANAGLPQILLDDQKSLRLQTQIAPYRCPSDIAGETLDSAPLTDRHKALNQDTYEERGVIAGGTSSYVANGGYFDLNHPLFISSPRGRGWQSVPTGSNNGLFFVTSHIHFRQIIDGRAHTIAIGERAWFQGSSTWVGTSDVQGVTAGDAGTCLGRVYWKINELPVSIDKLSIGEIPWYATPNKDLTSRFVATHDSERLFPIRESAREGFGSHHPGGAHFLMADGAVAFLGNEIDFANTIPISGADPLAPIPNAEQLGLFQKLGIRNDSFQQEEGSEHE